MNIQGDFILNPLVPMNAFSLLEEIEKKEATDRNGEHASSEYVSKTRC